MDKKKFDVFKRVLIWKQCPLYFQLKSWKISNYLRHGTFNCSPINVGDIPRETHKGISGVSSATYETAISSNEWDHSTKPVPSPPTSQYICRCSTSSSKINQIS